EKVLLQSQFETLKNQLNPHFLFNSLSALASLVHIDADRAEIFIDKLSKTYRYLLDQREKEIVPLREEINFFQNFSYLLKERYGKKILIDFTQDENIKDVYLLPQSFLIISEYILATNIISAANPLKIEIRVKNNLLLIKHNLAYKKSVDSNVELQQNELQKNYQRIGKQFAILKDEFEQTMLYKISLIIDHD
ncbi:MAG: histidine kinase, partial [Ginsengibacter sp.]